MTHSGSSADEIALLLLKVQREARCNPGEAVERRIKIEIADAVGECVDFIWGKHACEAQFRIDNEVNGLTAKARCSSMTSRSQKVTA
jgi:hypothetical protein